jgi:hypothetical protein
MKKEKAIELIKAGTHAIEMDCRGKKSVDLLNEILPNSSGRPFSGAYNYYFDFDCSDSTDLIPIKITSIDKL